MSSEHETRALETPQAVGPGRKQDVRTWATLSIQIVAEPGAEYPPESGEEDDYGPEGYGYGYGYEYGSTGFVGRIRIEVSLDGIMWSLPQNTELHDLSVFPHAYIEEIQEKVCWVRVRTLEYTSGELQVMCAGRRDVS